MSDVTAVTLGIDVGSRRVKAAVADVDGVVSVARFGDLAWLDSGVYVGADGTLSVGADGRQRALHRPQGWVTDPMARLTHAPFDVDGVRVDPVDVVAALLRVVRSRVPTPTAAGRGTVRMVVPAGWGPRRRTALRTALDRAGIADADLVAAPVAVAWHLAAGGVELEAGRCVVVCDFGAGFAASVVVRTVDGFGVLATIDAPSAGGAAMDAAVAAALAAGPSDRDAGTEIGTETGAGLVELPNGEALERARLAKEALSAAATVQVQVGAVPALFGVADLRTAVAGVVGVAVAAARQAIEAADVTADQVRWVVCVGGGARSPVIADAFTAGLGVRPVMVAQTDVGAALGAVQAPAVAPPADRSPAGGAAMAGHGVGAVVAAAGSIGLFGQFVAGADRYGPRQSIEPGMLLAHWGGLAFAAVLAVLAAVAGASWLGSWRFEDVADGRLRDRLYAVMLAGGAAVGAAVAAGFAVVGAGYFDVPAGPLLRWSVVAVLPVVAAVLVAAGVIWWRPEPDAAPGGSWPAWFRFPVLVLALVAAGAVLIGYDATGSPFMLEELRWWLERYTSSTNEIIGVTGRLGGACVGVAVALLLVRRVWLRVLVAVPVAGLTAVSLTWRTTGLIAAGFVAVTAWWWLWRALSAVAQRVLRAAARPEATADGHGTRPVGAGGAAIPSMGAGGGRDA